MKARFDFDSKPFMQGLEQIGGKLDGIQGKMGGMGQVIAKGAGKALTGLVKGVGALVAGFMAVKGVLNEMPEVGEAFGIAKNIFLKNLLWPLRQQVMPLLQKMLDWTRDHRTTFLKWGTVVANVFRTLIVVAKSLWTGLMKIVKVLTDSFQKAFKTNFRTLDEFLNVLSFKISAVAIFLGMLLGEAAKMLEPLIQGLADLIAGVLEFAGAVGEGFLKGFDADVIDRMVTALGEMLSAVGKLMSSPAMKALGELLGYVFAKELDLAARAIALAASTITGLITGDWKGFIQDLKGIGEWFVQPFRNAGNLLKAMGKGIGGTEAVDRDLIAAVNRNPKSRQAWLDLSEFEKASGLEKTAKSRIGEAAKYGVKLDDGIVTKDGRVIRTNPDDNIFAMKGVPQAPAGAFELNFNIQVAVTEGNARQAGVEFAEGVASRAAQMRSALLQSAKARGA